MRTWLDLEYTWVSYTSRVLHISFSALLYLFHVYFESAAESYFFAKGCASAREHGDLSLSAFACSFPSLNNDS